MDSLKPKVKFEVPLNFRIYEDGSVERLAGTTIAPPSPDDPETHVRSKDIVYSPQLNLSCRLYLPRSLPADKKIPLLLYIHGGGFCIYTAFSPPHHNFLNKLASEANALIVSVDYRSVPESPLPAAYHDAWTALKWVASHSNSDGPEEWLNHHADLGRVFFAGDSSGGNIAHNLGMRFGQEKLSGVNVIGIVPVHPFFWGKEPIDGEITDPEIRSMTDGLWRVAYPDSSWGSDDPLMNPALDPNLSKLGCSKVLVLVAERDFLMRRGWFYYENLKKSGWEGSVEIMESKGEEHNFHILTKPTCHNAIALLKKFATFLN